MIIPVHHVIVANYPIAKTTTAIAGYVAALDTNGYAVLCDADGSYTQPIGLFADKNRAAEAFEWVDRLSDSGNETAASGMASVFQGGGVFYLDVDDSRIATPAGTEIRGVIYASATLTVGQKLYTYTTAGMLCSNQTSSQDAVAIVVEPKAALSSGIPGEHEPDSVAFYSTNTAQDPRQWVKVKLLI
jgi:hypothetical protein